MMWLASTRVPACSSVRSQFHCRKYKGILWLNTPSAASLKRGFSSDHHLITDCILTFSLIYRLQILSAKIFCYTEVSSQWRYDQCNLFYVYITQGGPKSQQLPSFITSRYETLRETPTKASAFDRMVVMMMMMMMICTESTADESNGDETATTAVSGASAKCHTVRHRGSVGMAEVWHYGYW